jgi:hypothetical protein
MSRVRISSSAYMPPEAVTGLAPSSYLGERGSIPRGGTTPIRSLRTGSQTASRLLANGYAREAHQDVRRPGKAEAASSILVSSFKVGSPGEVFRRANNTVKLVIVLSGRGADLASLPGGGRCFVISVAGFESQAGLTPDDQEIRCPSYGRQEGSSPSFGLRR